MKPLSEMLRTYNADLEEYLKNNQIDENILFEAIQSYNTKAFNLLQDKVEITRKNELFLLAITHTPEIALSLFKQFKDDFNTPASLVYENFNTDDDTVRNFRNAEVFIDNNPLPRFYQDIQYTNAKEYFAAMLLNNSLRLEGHGQEKLETLEYLLKNRKEFNIKDETIVQYFAEGVYKLSYEDQDSSFAHHNSDHFKKVVDKLFEHNVSFASDTQGYLIQILAVNTYDLKRYRIDFDKGFIQRFIDNGSNIENYKSRLDNKDNWLNQQDDYKLEFYHERFQEYDYDIYKKFDSNNNALPLKYLQSIINYTFKEKIKPAEVATIKNDNATVLEKATSDKEVKPVIENTVVLQTTTVEPTLEKSSVFQKMIGSLRQTFGGSNSNKNDMKNN